MSAAGTDLQLVRLEDVAPQPWRNGGGSTQELLAGPDASAWQWRISVAQITQDGPFSAYPGVERWFVVLSGQGVALHAGPRLVHMTRASPPLQFDGAGAPGCLLLDGPTLDLNLMVRHDAGTGGLHAATPGQPWHCNAAQRAFFCTTSGHLQVDDQAALRTPEMSLLHSAHAAGQTWRWFADDPCTAAAWWLHFQPHPAAPSHRTLQP